MSRRIFKAGPIKVVLTDEDLIFKEEGEEIRLSEETGWWDEDGWVYVYTPGLSRLQRFGVGVHEFVESVLVRKLRMPSRWAHWVANVLEWVSALGRPVEQVWKR